MERPLLLEARWWSLVTLALVLVFLTALWLSGTLPYFLQHIVFGLIPALLSLTLPLVGVATLIAAWRWAAKMLREMRAIREQLEVLNGADPRSRR